ncbi:NADPH-dependent FMN reductase [Microvirga thermotolerans]|uniref:NADPH-dependent FMN reductase n=1 Tax=Microvirga thermotolerans TaxID=2651334 RepID=A0A5P9K043_9HYPH|nr:NAD(P)H-dependent oxidoreductase [Microvirga thermotolerans]QFU15574.1 NADPH-dependent FMN reductase [Microvirga thermotolerans]
MALKLHVIIASTRPGRAGPSIARWFHEEAVKHGKFEVELVDLADFKLPVYDEPEHPRLQKYRNEHTKAWSRSVAAADAYVFVTPEYNFNPSPSLVNALNYVYSEWNYKPAGFVSYGGVSGGLRAVQAAKLLVTALKMMPMMEGVSVPNFAQHLDAEKKFHPNELITASVAPLLDELHRWAEALKPMRG